LEVLNNIISARYIPKVNKYIVVVMGELKHKLWLTEKQMINLQNCFDETPKGYSNKYISVCGHWNSKGYYMYSTVEKRNKENLFNPPSEYNLNDLRDDD
jgi:hypothetical protein